jgi:transposase-like protein
MASLNAGMDKVLKRLHYPLDVMLTCVRWYVAYPLSLRNLEEMMAERGFGRSFDRASLGHQTSAGAGKDVSATQTRGRQKLANGRNLRQGQR